MNKILLFLLFVFTYSTSSSLLAQTTYYSRNTGGDWDNVNSWTLNPSGTGAAAVSVPSRTDHIIILNGSTILISAVDDNGLAGVTPNSLVTGGYPGGDTPAFYQIGDITIKDGGVLQVDAQLMTEGNVLVESGGELQTSDANNRDYIVHGPLQVESGATLNVGDDFILSDNSETLLNTSTLSSDDVYLNGTSAFLCGSGALTVGDAIQTFNSADPATQICDSFTITCTDGDCGNGSGSFTGSGGFTLPVELVHFAGVATNRTIQLDWTTAMEENFDFFTLERAGNDLEFEAVGTIQGNGFSTAPIDYQFSDKAPLSGTNYYRLKATDLDGSVEYHPTISIWFERTPAIQVYPNPVTNRRVHINGNATQLKILDLVGNTIFSQPIQGQAEAIQLPSELKAGTYIALLVHSNQPTSQQTLIVR